MSQISAWMGPSADQRGIVFHYGREGNNLVLGLSKVTLTEVGDHYEYPYENIPVRRLRTGLLEAEMSYGDWSSAHVTNRYFNGAPRLQVRRDDGPTYADVAIAIDARQEMLPYEMEIERLDLENLPPAGFNSYLVIRAASAIDPLTGRYYHRLALHIRHKSTSQPVQIYDRVSNHEQVTDREFDNHGADLGNLCPPNNPCGHYYVQPAKLKDYIADRK